MASWHPPLPPGWEGRWDNNQRAYFYIDHSNKKTTWEDPRPAYYAQQNKAAAARLLGNTSASQSHHGGATAIPLSTRSAQPAENKNVAESRFVEHETKQPPPDDSAKKLEEIAQRLHKTYPGARLEMIKDIVVACSNSEARAKTMLEGMGYAPSSLQPTATTSPKKSPSTSPHPSPKKVVAKQVSMEEKKRLRAKLKGEFKDQDDSIIAMALEAVNFDENKARTMLKGWSSRMETARARTADSGFSDSSSSRPSTSQPMTSTLTSGTEPVALDMDIGMPVVFGSTDTTASSSSSRQGSPKKKAATERPSSSKSRPSTATSSPKKTATSSPKKTASPKKTVTQPSAASRAKPGTTHSTGPSHRTMVTVTHQPNYVSEYRTKAQGPDPSLRNGPNKDLLLTDYTRAMGPNPEYRIGPDPDRVKGTMGAVGPDPSLRCGPMGEHTQQRRMIMAEI